MELGTSSAVLVNQCFLNASDARSRERFLVPEVFAQTLIQINSAGR